MGRRRSTTIGRNPLDALDGGAAASRETGPLDVLLGAAGSLGRGAGRTSAEAAPEPSNLPADLPDRRAGAATGDAAASPAEPEASRLDPPLRAAGGEPERRLGPAPGEVLTLRLGDETFGVALAEVREILGDRPVSRLPHVPSFVLGLVNVRGRVVPLLDLARRLGLPPRRGDGRGVIVLVDVDVGERVAVGLLVDDVLTVVSQASAQLGPPPAASRSTFLAGIGRCGDELLRLLDVGAVVGSEPLQRRVVAVPERSCRG